MAKPISIPTRWLEREECRELVAYLAAMPSIKWTDQDMESTLDSLLLSRQGIVNLPCTMIDDAIYIKLKWA